MYSLAELKKQFTNEQTFIILLLRLYLNSVTKQEVQDFVQSQAIDYKHVYRTASVHNIRPVLFQAISAHDLKVDPAFLQQLKSFYLQNQLRSMEQLTICNSILTELNAKDISAIPFKGTVFAYLYYGNIGLRESTDIDLLIQSNDIASIENYFKEKNFRAKVAVPAAYLNYYKKYFKEIVYTAPAKSNQGYSVEIHWKPLNYYFGSYPDFKFFKKGWSEINISEIRMPVLQPTYDFLAVVSNHFVKDMAVKFKYIMDISCLIAKSEHSLDVTLIDEVTKNHHCRKKVDYGLFIVEQLLGKRIAGFSPKYDFTERSLSSSLRVPLSIRDFNVTNRPFILRSIQLQDNFWQKIRFLSRCTYYFLLPTDNDLNSSTKGNTHVLLLAFIRPFRLAFKAIAQLSRRK